MHCKLLTFPVHRIHILPLADTVWEGDAGRIRLRPGDHGNVPFQPSQRDALHVRGQGGHSTEGLLAWTSEVRTKRVVKDEFRNVRGYIYIYKYI